MLRVLAAVVSLLGFAAPAAAQVVAPSGPPVPVRFEAPDSARFDVHRLVLAGPRSAWTGRRLDAFEPI